MSFNDHAPSPAGRLAPRDPESWPERYPFVVLRRERPGGFLFNRFLSYVPLDPLQVRTLELSEGYLTIADITAAIGPEFGLPLVAAERRVDAAFDLFDRLFAVQYREERRPGDYVLPPAVPTAAEHDAVGYAAPLYALWDITYACNLRCRHCLTDSKGKAGPQLPTREVCGIIDQLVDMKVFHVNFVGGEPFMRPDMFDILAYASERPIGFAVSTNGVLADDALVSRLAKLNIFDVQVSLDGLEQTHNDFRGVPGAFRKAADAVRRLASAGLRATINTVMTKRNRAELEAMVELAASLGAHSYKAVAFLPIGRGKQSRDAYALTAAELKDNIVLLRELGRKYEGTLDVVAEVNYPLPSTSGVETAAATSFPAMGCAAGITQIVIDPEGRVFACPFLHDFPAGDLRRQPLREIWAESELFNAFRHVDREQLAGPCRTCDLAGRQCRGGCRASAYAFTGDLWGEDPLCWNI